MVKGGFDINEGWWTKQYASKVKEMKRKKHARSKLERLKKEYRELKQAPQKRKREKVIRTAKGDISKLRYSTRRAGMGLNPKWFEWRF